MAATLVGAVLTAFLVFGVGSSAGNGDAVSDGSAAGLRIPSASTSTSPPTEPATGPATGPGTSAPATDPAPAPAPGPVVTATPATAAPGLSASPPTRVVLNRLGVDMAVEPQGVDDQGQMGLPPDPAVAGWYRFGAAPADADGAVVVAAHVDSRDFGIGPFSRLGSAQVGDEVRLDEGAVTRVYRVTQVARVDKAELDEEGLFSLSGPPRLHLVTCTGDYVDGSGYRQNLVVVAERVSS